MQFTSSDGRSFSLDVVGYEFPEEELGPTEDNPADEFDHGRFLIVRVGATTPEGKWQATAAEMSTDELERFGDWLDSILTGRPSTNGVYFTERDLEFSLSDDGRILRVHLDWDFRPPWQISRDVTIPFPIVGPDLAQAIASIRSKLVEVPHRPWPTL